MLEALPQANRLAFATTYQVKIQNGWQLARVLKALSQTNREAFLTARQAKIQDGRQLVYMLNALPEANREAFATAHQAKIQDGDQLALVLVALPQAARLNFVMIHQSKITNINAFDRFIRLIEGGDAPLTPDEKRRLAEACCSAVRVAYSLREKNYSRDLFNDPGAQQLIALQKMDANVFLFAAAIDPASDADFDYFLNHALCSVTAVNERGQNLALFIEEQASLSPALKEGRIARVKAAQESQRQAIGRQTIGFNLGSIKETASTFSGALPEAVGVDWTVPGVDAAEIARFRQLIQWLRSQPMLASFLTNFSALDTNDAIRTTALFKRSAEALETFVAELAHYLEKNPASTADDKLRLREDLSLRLEASEQLAACAEGVLNALQAMTRSLNSSASIAMVADTALDRAIMSFITLTGISKRMEVHASKDRLLGLLGLDSAWRYDAHRLPISPVYLQAIVRNAMGRLTPDYLISQSVPSLESLTATSLRFNAEGRALLERDWQVLYSTGLLTKHTNEGSAKWVAVMRFINSAMTEGQAEEIKTSWADVEIARDLTVETLSARYQTLLESKGILTLTAEKMSVMKTGIWCLLTSEDSTPNLNALLARLLKAPNGLNLIKEVIDSHTPAEQSQICLSTLLRCPEGSSMNIFRSFAADPYFAGWMMGWQFSATRTPAGSVLGFTPALSCPLANVVAQLAANEALMHKELEEIFMLPGNLLFWLGELQKDPQRQSTFECILSFLSAQPLYQFDTVLVVLDKMMSAGDALQKITARSFLEARCAEQKSQGLWHCYWKTASYVSNFELVFDSKDMLLSLKDPANARVAVFISGSNQVLAVKITQALVGQLVSQGECAAIIKTIQGLYPPSAVAQAASAASPPADLDDESGASAARRLH